SYQVQLETALCYEFKTFLIYRELLFHMSWLLISILLVNTRVAIAWFLRWANLSRVSKALDVPSKVWYYVSGLLRLFMIWHKRLISLVIRLRLCTERSHSGLVRRFAKPLRWKRLREFESLPLRHQ